MRISLATKEIQNNIGNKDFFPVDTNVCDYGRYGSSLTEAVNASILGVRKHRDAPFYFF